MPTAVKKIPSCVKGLVETRARAASDVERCRRIAGDVARELERAENGLASANRMIRRFDPSLEPKRIPPIRTQAGRYGQRGAFKAATRAHLLEHTPEAVTTFELDVALKIRFGLGFATAKEERRWVWGSFTNRLRKMAAEGVLERLYDPRDYTEEVGRWRWIADCARSPDRLAEQAAAQGTEVLRYGDVCGQAVPAGEPTSTMSARRSRV